MTKFLNCSISSRFWPSVSRIDTANFSASSISADWRKRVKMRVYESMALTAAARRPGADWVWGFSSTLNIRMMYE